MIDGQIVANRMMCGEDRELFFLVGRRFGLDSRDSEAAPLLVESVLSGLCLVNGFRSCGARDVATMGRGGNFFQNVLPLLMVL